MSDIQKLEANSAEAMEMQLNAQMRHAEVLSNSNMLPDKFKGNPANVLMAKEIANSMGETPWVTMTELYFVGNTPTFSAKYMRTRVRQAGHILRESFDEATMTATCVIIRSDDPEYEHVVTWNKAKAVAHGLWDKGHWKKNPQLMMKNRAVSECVREACNEVMGGVNYTPEEAESMQTVHATSTRMDVQRGADGVRAALAAKKEEPQPEPAPVNEDGDFLTSVQQHLATLDSQDDVNAFMKSLQESGDQLPEEVLAAGRQRWEELN